MTVNIVCFPSCQSAGNVLIESTICSLDVLTGKLRATGTNQLVKVKFDIPYISFLPPTLKMTVIQICCHHKTERHCCRSSRGINCKVLVYWKGNCSFETHTASTNHEVCIRLNFHLSYCYSHCTHLTFLSPMSTYRIC